MLIPVVNNEFYPRWFPLDLLCLHSSFYVRFQLPLVPCRYDTQLPYCLLHKKSDARFEKLHSDSTRPLLCASVCQFILRFVHPRLETRSTQTKGPRGFAALNLIPFAPYPTYFQSVPKNLIPLPRENHMFLPEHSFLLNFSGFVGCSLITTCLKANIPL